LTGAVTISGYRNFFSLRPSEAGCASSPLLHYTSLPAKPKRNHEIIRYYKKTLAFPALTRQYNGNVQQNGKLLTGKPFATLKFL